MLSQFLFTLRSLLTDKREARLDISFFVSLNWLFEACFNLEPLLDGAVLGLAVLGLAVLGLAVPGLAVPGLAVPGLAVPGLVVFGDCRSILGSAVPGSICVPWRNGSALSLLSNVAVFKNRMAVTFFSRESGC
jgi:hypothetical protein